jgi:glycosyltransferase involved in cell wall biosynthesis
MLDPWSLVVRTSRTLASPVYFHLAAKHERRVFECASLILSNTELATKSLRDFYPALSSRFVTIMNGCDDEPLPLPRRKRTFVIAYAGEIYIDRDPRLLFRAVGRVVRDLKLTPEHIFLRFIGGVESLNGVSLYTMADQEGVRSHISLGPRRPYAETLKFLADAKMLVLLPQDSYTAIPAKLFEYLRFPSWVLALAEEDSATGLLLKGSGADLVRPDDLEHMIDVIRRRYLEHADGVEPTPIAKQGNFDRQSQARMLLRYLDSLT